MNGIKVISEDTIKLIQNLKHIYKTLRVYQKIVTFSLVIPASAPNI